MDHAPKPLASLRRWTLYLLSFATTFGAVLLLRSGSRTPAEARAGAEDRQPILECQNLSLSDLPDAFVLRTPAGTRDSLKTFLEVHAEEIEWIRDSLRQELKRRALLVASCAATSEPGPLMEVRYEWTLKADLPRVRAEGFRLSSVSGTSDRERLDRVGACFMRAYAAPIETTATAAIRAFEYEGLFPYLGAFRIGS